MYKMVATKEIDVIIMGAGMSGYLLNTIKQLQHAAKVVFEL